MSGLTIIQKSSFDNHTVIEKKVQK